MLGRGYIVNIYAGHCSNCEFRFTSRSKRAVVSRFLAHHKSKHPDIQLPRVYVDENHKYIKSATDVTKIENYMLLHET